MHQLCGSTQLSTDIPRMHKMMREFLLWAFEVVMGFGPQ